MVVFALSKLPHLHRAYLVTVCNQKFIAVNAGGDEMRVSLVINYTASCSPVLLKLSFLHRGWVFLFIFYMDCSLLLTSGFAFDGIPKIGTIVLVWTLKYKNMPYMYLLAILMLKQYNFQNLNGTYM